MVSGTLTQSLSKIRDKNFFFEIEGSPLWIKKKNFDSDFDETQNF